MAGGLIQPNMVGAPFVFYTMVFLVMRPFFAFRQKSLFIPGCVQGVII